ncbi:MAG: substrate-binding domain-containing protein [Planctomycetales bacterium]|nr:substrate-binding domain-containing protein [Planctomycetales bacterium]
MVSKHIWCQQVHPMALVSTQVETEALHPPLGRVGNELASFRGGARWQAEFHFSCEQPLSEASFLSFDPPSGGLSHSRRRHCPREREKRFVGTNVNLFRIVALLISFALFAGCDSGTPTQQKLQTLRLATTTSTNDSGLLDVLVPKFESTNTCEVQIIAVGTGAALRLGEAGDVDVLIVHARDDELQFMQAEHGTRHHEFMFNHFVLVGPKDDPARIAGLATVDAFRKILAQQQPFVSRGDDSGTHKREMQIWADVGEFEPWNDYLSVGQGMGRALEIADEKNAYTISDVGTFLKRQSDVELVVYSGRDQVLHNPYSVIVVNPNKSKLINHDLANLFYDFLLSPETQEAIESYRANGNQLFWSSRPSSSSGKNQ